MMSETVLRRSHQLKRCRKPLFLVIIALSMLAALLHIPFERLYGQMNHQYRKYQKVRRRIKSDDQSGGESNLNLVMVVAFPLSGTNALMHIAQKSSGLSMATNYGHVVETKSGWKSMFYDSVPADSNAPNGPFKFKYDSPVPLEGKEILVKTHCSGHCIDKGDASCRLPDYLLPLNDFRWYLRSCASGTSYISSEQKIEHTLYDFHRTSKLIFMVRDPLEIVRTRWISSIQAIPYNQPDLTSWCKTYDNQDGSIELRKKYYPKEARRHTRKLPCHAELYRIVRYYEQGLKIRNFVQPAIGVHFEDLRDDYDNVVNKVFNFVEIPRKESSLNENFFEWDARDDEYESYPRRRTKTARAFLRDLIGDNQELLELLGRYL